jgi:hypothetical protein
MGLNLAFKGLNLSPLILSYYSRSYKCGVFRYVDGLKVADMSKDRSTGEECQKTVAF